MQRSWLVLATICVFWLVMPVQSVRAAGMALDAAKMKVALHTATVEEGGFIEYVVDQVQHNQLPASLVESTFLWARKKPMYRFQYFKRGLILRAQQLGIAL